jgi:ABC-type uncharacterized transport system substrate-binding protein
MAIHIGRRECIITLGGATAAWSLAARAQQPAMPVVGYLHIASPEPYTAMMSAFRDGLKQGGYVEGQNVLLEFRWAEGQVGRLRPLAAELARRRVNVLATGGGDEPPKAAKLESATIPIVFVTSDPVASGLVSNLNRPGGNLTGVSIFTVELGPKRLELLRELVAKSDSFAVLVDPDTTSGRVPAQEMSDAARRVGQQIEVFSARSEQEIDAAFVALVQKRPDALLVVSSPLFHESTAPDCGAREPTSHSHHLSIARIRCFRWSDELRHEHHRCLSSERRLCGPHTERREACRTSNFAADEVRFRNQSKDCEGTWD